MISKEIKEKLKSWSSSPPSEKPIFHCPVCNQIYHTMEDMMACLNRKVEPGPFKVGDIVMVSGKWVGYGSYTNDQVCMRLKDHSGQVYGVGSGGIKDIEFVNNKF